MARSPIALATTLFLGLGFCAPALAGIALDQDDNLQNLGIFFPSFFAELQDLQMVADTAYVFGVGGLAILDIQDTANPWQRGRYEPPGHPYVRFYRGAVNGNLAIGGAREDLAFIIDVSSAATPDVVAVHGQFGQSFEGVAIDGSTAYLCAHGDGLEIVDLTVPRAPQLLATIPDLVNSWDIALQGNLAYVADGSGGLAVIDITEPSAPQHLVSLPTSGAANDVVTDGSVLVVTCGSAGVDVFTLEDPASPTLQSTINTSGLAITAALDGSLVHVADWDDVETYDLTSPWSPQPVGGEFTPVRAMGLDAREGLVAVADWSSVRLYQAGPSVTGDISVSVDRLQFGSVPLGSSADRSFLIGNTGNAAVTVSEVAVFNSHFQVLPPAAFTVLPGQTHEVTVRFTPAFTGFDGTFLRINSDDGDETQINFSVTADNDPYRLDIGDPAPQFTLQDMEGVPHRLSDQLGKVVVMAFFANW